MSRRELSPRGKRIALAILATGMLAISGLAYATFGSFRPSVIGPLVIVGFCAVAWFRIRED